jgi:serine/threonine protein kinase/protein involved in polysaccharide export with SLBB domain
VEGNEIMNPHCYTPEQLREYSLGQLPDEQSELISQHVEVCPTCEETLVGLDKEDDTLIRTLRTPVDSPSGDDESALRNLIVTAKEKRQTAASAESPDKNGQPPLEVDDDIPASGPNPFTTTHLGHYRLLEPIGHGGMGVIYRAQHDRLQRDVAIKILPNRKLVHASAAGRFRREMRAVGQLHHPAIVQATDAGEIDGIQYLAMEYIDGLDLATIVRRCGPLDVPAVCHTVRQAALGLAYAHEQGIIHRDVKPSNLMITVDGQVKILDLGLALLGAAQSAVDELTTIGQLMGTLDYMAPEQCENSHDVDQRADVYSLGATTYKLLTGKAPYESGQWKGPLQKLRAIAITPAAPIGSVVSHLPESLASAIDRCLAHERDQRMGTMHDVVEALEPFSVEVRAATLAELVKRARSLTDPSEPAGDSADGLLSQRPVKPNPEPEPPQSVGPVAVPAARSRASRIGRLARYGLALAGCVALAVIIAIRTNQGEVVIETARPDVEVKIKRSGKEYQKLELTQGEKRLRVAAGDYEIELLADHDSLEVKDGVFTLKRGDIWVAKIVEKGKDNQLPARAFGEREYPRSTAFDLDPNKIKIGQSLTLKGPFGGTREFVVFGDGSIRLEDLGSIHVAGKSLDAVSNEMREAYRAHQEFKTTFSQSGKEPEIFLTFSPGNIPAVVHPATEPRRAAARVPDPRRLEIGQQLDFRGIVTNEIEKLTIFADGSIIVPYLGSVKAAGRSLDEIRTELFDRFASKGMVNEYARRDTFILTFSSEQPTWTAETNNVSPVTSSSDPAQPGPSGSTNQGKNFDEASTTLLSERDSESVKAAMDVVARLGERMERIIDASHEKNRALISMEMGRMQAETDEALRRFTGSQIAMAILAYLKSEDEQHRVLAAKSLHYFLKHKVVRAPEFRELYEELLRNRNSTNPDVAKEVHRALSAIADTPIPPDWLVATALRLLDGDDVDVALASCTLLARTNKHNEKVVERLRSILVSGTTLRQERAAYVATTKLAKEDVKQLMPELLQLLRDGQGHNDLWSSLPEWLVANVPHTNETLAELEELAQRFPDRRDNILSATQSIREEMSRKTIGLVEGKSLQEWLTLLNDPDPRTSKTAIDVIGKRQVSLPNKLELILKAGARHPWNEIGDSVINALARMPLDDVARELLVDLKSDDEHERSLALRCIPNLPLGQEYVQEVPELFDTLLRIRRSSNEEHGKAAVPALFRLALNHRFTDRLEATALELVDGADFDLGLIACTILTKSVLYQEKAIDRLRISLRSEDAVQRAAAAYVVITTSDAAIARLLSDVIQFLKDWKYDPASPPTISLIDAPFEPWSSLLKEIANNGPHSAETIVALENLHNEFAEGSLQRSMIASVISNIRRILAFRRSEPPKTPESY